jgi:tetratricopeptide (TPR) repeat protein
LAIKEEVLGKENEDLINNLNNLAIVYSRLNRHPESRELRGRADKLMRAKVAASEQKDIDTMIHLADKLNAEKKQDEAREILEKALHVARSEFGADSLKAAQVLNFLATITLGNGDSDRAKDYFIPVLRIQKKQLGKKHPEVAHTLRSIALCLNTQGMGETSALLNQQAQAIEKLAGVEDPEIAAMRKAFNQRRDAKGPKDPAVIQNMRLLSEVYRMRGNLEEADALYEEFLKAREEEVGADSLDLAQELVMKALTTVPMLPLSLLHANLATDVDEGEAKKCISLLRKAIGIQEKVLVPGTNGDELVDSLGHLAAAFALIKNFDEAESAARQAIALAERSKGNEHWSLAVPLTRLKAILEATGKKEEANAIEERRKALPVATRKEQDEHTRRITERMFGSMGRMLQSLGALADTEGTEGESGPEDNPHAGGTEHAI